MLFTPSVFPSQYFTKTPLSMMVAMALCGVPFSISQAATTANAAVNTNTTSPANTSPATSLPTLADITVTASRSPTQTANTIAQTTVIGSDTLQRFHGQSVLDVLKSQAGINFYESGGQGGLSNFWLRGFSGKQVLVLVDGVRYGSTTSGVAAINLLPADQIDRIEVLYGASGSSLYGADAMGGVIQIFTKGQNAQYSNGSVTLGAGSQNSYHTQATGQYVNHDTVLSLSAGHEQTAGFNATVQTPSPYSDYNPDKDGFKSDNVSLVAKHRFTSDDGLAKTDVGMTGIYAKSTSHYDTGLDYKDAHADQQNGATTAFVNYQREKLNANFKYGESVDKSKAYDSYVAYDKLPYSQYNTLQRQANLQLDYSLPVGKVIGGAEWLKQSLDTNKPDYVANDRTVKSGFLGYQITQPTYDLQANVRHDDNSQFGNHTTYNLGAAYRIFNTPESKTRLGGSYATGFRAPTFNELYFPNSGNAKLKPEQSNNSELFIENRSKLQTTRLTGFYSDINNIIASDPANNYIPFNLDKARIKGVTLTSDWQKGHVIFGGNYTRQSTENRSLNSNQGKALPYHPDDTGLVYLGYRQYEFDIRTEVQHVGKRFSNAANTSTVDGYTLLNISSNYYINPRLTVNARINNLTNQNYQTIKDYNSNGINSMVSLTYEWF